MVEKASEAYEARISKFNCEKNESIFEMQKEQPEAEVVWSKKWKGVAY